VIDGLHRKPNPVSLLPTLLRAVAYRAAELGTGPCLDPNEVPRGGAAVSSEWLSAVLGEQVSRVEYELVSSGTSERGRLKYLGATGDERQAFVKSTPSLVTRIANGATGTSQAEVRFFQDLRPELGMTRVPYGYYSAFDPKSLRSIHLLEDLSTTGSVRFPTPADQVTRPQIESAVELLARVHRTFDGFRHQGIATYRQWWETNLRVANVQRAVERVALDDFCPSRLRSGRRLWSSAVRSIEMHDGLVPTLLHGDPHLGNWYFWGADEMGLLDWQCVSAGHWSRDLAYTITTMLTVEQRRDWEDDLLDQYHDQAKLSEPPNDAKDRYRKQIPGGLLMWAPTLHRPRGFPEMQSDEMCTLMLARILAAVDDHLRM